MPKTLDSLVTETLGAQLRMILELQATVEALREENAALKAKDAPAPEVGT
jgi:hypothetical protein